MPTTLQTLCLVLAGLTVVTALPTRHPTFEIRRPIKYYFHLLELKSSTSGAT